jgi:hypothetical protein
MKFLGSAVPLGFCVCGLLALTGCGGNTRATGPLVPVKGKVTLGGKPLVGGAVTFVPAEGAGSGPMPTGDIDSQGLYSLRTGAQEGAPVGKYRAIVTTGGEDKTQEAQFNSVYSSAQKSPLVVEVTENARPGAYDLPLVPLGGR